jgi:hypothetical protein
MGHPALLSFAKLLLELDFGQNIEIDISPDFSENEQAWCQLMGRIEHLEQERCDSYVEAIRGCFMVPYMISKALRSRRSKNKDVDSIIRKHIYKEIVYKLKLGYDQSNFVSARKWQRSGPSSQSSGRDGNQAPNSVRMAKRSSSVEPERTIPTRLKKRRMPEPQAPPSLFGLIHRDTGNLCTNEHKGVHGFADSYVPTFIDIVPKWNLCTFISLPTTNPHIQSTFAIRMPVYANQQPTKTRRDQNQIYCSQPLISYARHYKMGHPMRPSRRDDFDIAIICTTSFEYDAISYIFDEFWDEDGDQYRRAAGDTNHYTTGRMGNYSVVLALLPQMGKVGAASAAASMRSSYTGLRLALLTGV